jgi:hypothetical protein
MSDPDAQDITNHTASPTGSPPPPSQPSGSTTEYKEANASNSAHKRSRKLPKTPKWIEAACAVLLVFITGFYTFYAARQANASKKAAQAALSAAVTANQTLKEIQKGSADTHELAIQAKNQADRTKDVADKTLSLTMATNTLAEQTKRAANAAQGASKVASESFALIQRPWVGVDLTNSPILALTPEPNVADRLGLMATFTLRNYGLAPALKISTFAVAASTFEKTAEASNSACGAADVWFEQKEKGYMESTLNQKVGFTLFPGQTFPISYSSAVEKNFADLWLMGCIVYADVFGKKHKTKFCELGFPDGSSRICHVQNYAD